MTEEPRVRVRAANLNGEAPAALRDSTSAFDLDIDFSFPPELIAEALTGIFQESVDSHRWTRRGTCGHEQPPDEPEQRGSPHPYSPE